MKKIEVIPYNPKWKTEFEKAKKFYEELLIGLNIKVEHVGSTSVQGLWAKPILDIDIIVPNEEVSKIVIEKLRSVGYEHRGDLGIKGREAFGYSRDNKNITWMEHHLYVCEEGNENLNNHLKLRDHLRKNPDAIKKYGKLKQELAKKYPNDMDAYVEGKTELITHFLSKEGMENGSLNRIALMNKKIK